MRNYNTYLRHVNVTSVVIAGVSEATHELRFFLHFLGYFVAAFFAMTAKLYMYYYAYIVATNRIIACKVMASWSRCGECRQSGSTSRLTGPATPRSIASSCASDPYSSSAP
jgi:hypothetical protein